MDTGQTTRDGDRRGKLSFTVIALFDDEIDAEQALSALRKANSAADRVSLVVRDRATDDGGADEHAGAVARATVAKALDAVSSWLQGLSSLIVPDRGTFLVAGPIGAALASVGADDGQSVTAVATAGGLDANGLLRTLAEFGFGPDEATYVEHRLVAGTTLVAVTTGDEQTLGTARRFFADHNAVYIGLAETDAAVFAEAESLLTSPPERLSGGAVIVADAVAPIRRLSKDGGPPPAAALLRREVVDASGESVGEVDDVLMEAIDVDGPSGPEPEQHFIRYLVVGHGGLLGVRRHRVAIPVAAADLKVDPIRLTLPKASVEHAPAFDEDEPFSRREEQAVFVHFGLPPHWQEASSR